MKHNYKIDYSANAIVATKGFLEEAEIFGTEEYKILQSIRNDYPNMRVVTRSVRTGNRHSDTKGITYKYMRKFIAVMDRENLITFEETILHFEEHSENKTKVFHQVREWFLENYPYHAEMIVDTAPKRIIKPIPLETKGNAAQKGVIMKITINPSTGGVYSGTKENQNHRYRFIAAAPFPNQLLKLNNDSKKIIGFT